MSKTQELLPIKKGDNFILRFTNEHYVCMGWKNGHLRAAFHTEDNFYIRSMSVDFLLHAGYIIFPSAEYDEYRKMRKYVALMRACDEVLR